MKRILIAVDLKDRGVDDTFLQSIIQYVLDGSIEDVGDYIDVEACNLYTTGKYEIMFQDEVFRLWEIFNTVVPALNTALYPHIPELTKTDFTIRRSQIHNGYIDIMVV